MDDGQPFSQEETYASDAGQQEASQTELENIIQRSILTRKEKKALEMADLSVLETVFPDPVVSATKAQKQKSVTFQDDTKPEVEAPIPENSTRRSARLKAQKAGLKYDIHGIQLPQIRPKRSYLTKGPFDQYLDSLLVSDESPSVPIPSPRAFAVKAKTDEEERTPANLEEALLGPDRELWIESINEEFESIDHHEVYRWAPCPENVRPLNSGYVFRIKPAADGKPERFKTRVVVRGNEQKEGFHFDGSALYAPVVKHKSLRFTCALAVQLDIELHKMDIKTAFLHGELEEKLYLKPPLGVVCPPKQEGWVWELKKALYGLKQAPRQWNLKLHDYMSNDLGFQRLESDWGIYLKREGKKLTIVDIYVDDLFLGSTDLSAMFSLKKEFAEKFPLVDSGKAESILGINIQQEEGRISLDQRHYIDEILSRFGQQNSKGKKMPLQVGQRFSVNDFPANLPEKISMMRTPYREAVGSLMHLMVCTRPDIANSVGVVSRFLENPGPKHWEAVERILQYIKLTRNYGLVYEKCGSVHGVLGDLHGFCDADWAGDRDDYRSTAGWVFLMSGAAISWSSKKIATPSQSTCDAEYVAQGRASQEQVWLRQLMEELHVAPVGPISLRLEDRFQDIV